jgi:two-component system, chemotaxis family, chemotaxis protein CheV
MSELLKSVDARTKLAGTNKLEILMFTLGVDATSGRRETFGVNVFKVREVMRTPEITRAPEMPDAVEGMVSLRGKLVPVLDLAKYTGVRGPDTKRPEIMIVTEFNGQMQGLLVEGVETILRIDWSAMRVPPHLIAGKVSGLVTAVTELPDGKLVMMLDVEQLLAECAPTTDAGVYKSLGAKLPPGRTVLFADDSAVARTQITRTLDALGVSHIAAANGLQAWQELARMADDAKARGRALRDDVQLVLTDVEMPEMDGYMLAKRIRADARFKDLPVIMHSSLSGASNQQLGHSVGIDEYVSKFEPAKLAAAISRRLG